MVVDMNYHDIASILSISEEQFAKSFMYGRFKVYLQNRTDYVFFFELLYVYGELRMAGITDKSMFGEVYDDNFKGKSVLVFIERPPRFAGSDLPAGSYSISIQGEDNPHMRSNWSDVIRLNEYRRSTHIYGELSNEIRKRNQLIYNTLTQNGGDTMSRRIGNFYDEKTGETHWLEPSSVKDYPLPPGRIAELGQAGYKTVHYELTSNEAERTIDIVASVELSNGKKVESDPTSMDELTFAQLLFEAYANDETFANKDKIKEFTDLADSTLAINAYKSHGTILNGLSVDGFGSIYYEKDRVATFDGISIEIEPYSDSFDIEIINSVSQTTLSEDKRPTLTFLSSSNMMSVSSFDIKKTEPGIVTQYSVAVNTQSVLVEASEEQVALKHQYTESVDHESPYMTERTALLASADLEDDAFEDRFEDIFSF